MIIQTKQKRHMQLRKPRIIAIGMAVVVTKECVLERSINLCLRLPVRE